MSERLEFFVPSNRHNANGTPKHMDGSNEIIGSGLTNRNFASRRKRENTEWVARHARAAADMFGWQVPKCRVKVTTIWYETSEARDLDNIYGGIKYVLDGLGRPSRWSESKGKYLRNPYGAGVIEDDSQEYVSNTVFDHKVDKDHPGVRVIIETEE